MKKFVSIILCTLLAGACFPEGSVVSEVNAETHELTRTQEVISAKKKSKKKKKKQTKKSSKKTASTSKTSSKKKTSKKSTKKTKKKKTVKDTTPPVITVENGQLVRGSTYTASDYYKVTDNKTADPKVTVDGDVDTGTEGEYTVTVTAVDGSKNESSSSYTITVVAPTCDGTTVTEGCVLDGVRYNRYVYHPAVEQQSHMEQRSSQEQVITGYCTLCMDNTYSPSCATGKGACSHHGGVQQWNAPRYGTQTNTWEEEVIDVPAQAEYFETEVAQ